MQKTTTDQFDQFFLSRKECLELAATCSGSEASEVVQQLEQLSVDKVLIQEQGDHTAYVVHLTKPIEISLGNPLFLGLWRFHTCKRVGIITQVECDSCGYTSLLHYGRGWADAVEPSVCMECRELVDVPIDSSMVLTGKHGACPRCERGAVLSWIQARQCPKCSGPISENHCGFWD